MPLGPTTAESDVHRSMWGKAVFGGRSVGDFYFLPFTLLHFSFSITCILVSGREKLHICL